MKKLILLVLISVLTISLFAQSTSRIKCYAYWEGIDFVEWDEFAKESEATIIIRMSDTDPGITIYEPNNTIVLDGLYIIEEDNDDEIMFTALDRRNNILMVSIEVITRSDGSKVMMITVMQENKYYFGYLGKVVN